MQALFGILSTNLGESCCCPVSVVMAVVTVGIEVILQFCIGSKESVHSLVDKVEVVFLCATIEDSWKDCVELTRLKVCMIADAVEDL